ncbi:MAG: tetraacyldisaccharide 4'-kinase [Kiritimatiellaeota bacterium]|nr:tetraacyldisaccharide 4'-kinase [Kiritimatiellota bacterium]
MGRRLTKIIERIEKSLVKVIQEPGADQNQPWPMRILLAFAALVSGVFGLCSRLRLLLYRIHVLNSSTLVCKVISVGNLTAGGTGKTPVVECLARELQRRGRRVAILSRGYRKKEVSWFRRAFFGNLTPPRVVSDGKRVLLDSEMGGDEPYMLANNLNGVAVVVDKNRVKAGRHAVEQFQCDTLLLDDGFQYLKLRRSLEIALVDAGNPFGNGRLLPRGVLREPARNIRRADFVFITKSPGGSAALREKINALKPGAEIVECNHAPRRLTHAYTGEHLPLTWLNGKKILALSGIASPKGFENFCRGYGATLGRVKRFADHHRYTADEILGAINDAADAGLDALVTTEKDAVRFPRLQSTAIPVCYLRVEIEIISGADVFERVLRRVCEKTPRDPATP